MLRGTPRIERLTIASARLPTVFDGLTIAAVSDLHAGRRRGGAAGILRVIETVNALEADVIVLLGDIVHKPRYADEYLPLLGALRARRGIWATLGNHERAVDPSRSGPPPHRGLSVRRWREMYAELGINLLHNEATALFEPGGRIWVVGVGDTYSGRDDLDTALRDVAGGEYLLGITHSPDLLDDPRVAELDLVLAGHTHGGQIRLPLVGALYAPVKSPRRRAAGMLRESGTLMYVSRGIGEGIPIRINCPREIPLITLRADRTVRHADSHA